MTSIEPRPKRMTKHITCTHSTNPHQQKRETAVDTQECWSNKCLGFVMFDNWILNCVFLKPLNSNLEDFCLFVCLFVFLRLCLACCQLTGNHGLNGLSRAQVMRSGIWTPDQTMVSAFRVSSDQTPVRKSTESSAHVRDTYPPTHAE